MTEPAGQHIAVARDYAELQAALREIADASGWSRLELDRICKLPDGFCSKALAPVPIGTCQLGTKTLPKLLRGLRIALMVVPITPALDKEADLAVKRREDRVHARLLDQQVYNAAKSKLARENGKKGQKALRAKLRDKEQQSRKRRRAAKARWGKLSKTARRQYARHAVNARWAKARAAAAAAMLSMPT